MQSERGKWERKKKCWLYFFGLRHFEFEVPEGFPTEKYLVGSWLFGPIAQKRDLSFSGNDKRVISKTWR